MTADGDANEFFKLVECVTRHTHPSAVLFEIRRYGAAVLINRGITLIRRTVVLSGDKVRSFDFVGRDIDLMLKACEENLSQADPGLCDLTLILRTCRIGGKSVSVN